MYVKFILGRMADAGLQNKLFYSVQRDEVYCKIRCALPRYVSFITIIDTIILTNYTNDAYYNDT
jgi:hypothetical protein